MLFDLNRYYSMIKVNNLSKSFKGVQAVRGLSFEVQEGEIFVLLGTSGCGKTTTLKMINRLMEADTGEVVIDGEPLQSHQPEIMRRKMGYVLQNHGLFPHYTIGENIAVVPDLLGWDKGEIDHRARILLEKFNLSPSQYLDIYPGQLSGGQQQRVGFIRALMANPPIILMDEPLGALDPITRHQIQEEFKHLDELKDKTIIMVTHDISEAIALGNRICLMDNGRIQQIGSPTDLLLRPENTFVKEFFAGDRMLYQMKALRIDDLKSFFKPIEPNEHDALLSPDLDVMEAMEHLSERDSETTRSLMEDKTNDQFYRLDTRSLLRAFDETIRNEHQ